MRTRADGTDHEPSVAATRNARAEQAARRMPPTTRHIVVVGTSAGGLEALDTLVNRQSEKIEETMWIALRMFEERKNLINNMVMQERHAPRRRALAQRASEANVHIDRIRAMLLAPQSGAK